VPFRQLEITPCLCASVKNVFLCRARKTAKDVLHVSFHLPDFQNVAGLHVPWRRRGGHVSADGAGTTLGVCSDRWGNQDFQYIRLPETMTDWTPVSLRFGAPMTGEFRLMLRDRAEDGDLLIRDLRIVRTGR
jgi:hypothetical protein